MIDDGSTRTRLMLSDVMNLMFSGKREMNSEQRMVRLINIVCFKTSPLSKIGKIDAKANVITPLS